MKCCNCGNEMLLVPGSTKPVDSPTDDLRLEVRMSRQYRCGRCNWGFTEHDPVRRKSKKPAKVRAKVRTKTNKQHFKDAVDASSQAAQFCNRSVLENTVYEMLPPETKELMDVAGMLMMYDLVTAARRSLSEHGNEES